MEEKYIEADEAFVDYEKCLRVPGQAMKDQFMSLRLCQVRMQKEDPGSSVRNLSYARKMLRRAGLTRVEQRHVLGTARAAWDASSIATALS